MLAPDGRSRPALLYRLPPELWAADGEQLAVLVDSLPIVPLASNDRTWVTDAALSAPDSAGARQVAVRTYERVFVFAADPVSGRPAALLQTCALDALHERYGEGVTWLPDGRLLFVAEGRSSPLQAGRCP
jgi:hypothetical protein